MEKDFHILKTTMFESPVVANPSINYPIIVETDASGTDLVAILSQKVEMEN